MPLTRRAFGATMLGAWALAFLVILSTHTFSDDHFHRISSARQVARYGELPFRDFLDPGYFLTEFASAAVQILLGDNLLGEMLLNSAFIATGAILVFALTRRVSPSGISAAVISLLVVLSAPRAYDFDKFLFYPLGILLCWRYVDRRSTGSLVMLAAVAVLAGVFRYDNGLFIASAGLVAVAVTHGAERAVLMRRVGMFAAAGVVCAAPYLLFLQLNGGVIEAADQMLTYARREGGRTRVRALPSEAVSELHVTRLAPPPPDRIQIRWTPDADVERAELERRYTLHDGVVRGDAESRTWLYEIANTSRDNLRALIDNPRVADTHMVDRATARLTPQESLATRIRRRIPVVGEFAISWSASGAAAFLFYVFVGAPIAVIVIAVRRRRAVDAGERARVLSAAAMALLVALFILREPIVARLGGACGPIAVVGAWLWSRVHTRLLARGVATLVVIAAAVASEWDLTAYRLERNFPLRRDLFALASTTPPPTDLLPKPQEAGLVEYLRRCTRPDDRVFAAWFAPQLYFFSGRGFAGGMSVTFGRHWSEPRYQRRIVEKMMAESVPLVILMGTRSAFRDEYPLVDDYLHTRYRDAGMTAFGPDRETTYTVLAQSDRVPTSVDAASSMPCFAGRS
jgi:hypothetical protein